MAIAASPSTNGHTPSKSEPDPIEPIPHDRFETIEFPARDGFTLNFKHLRGGWGPAAVGRRDGHPRQHVERADQKPAQAVDGGRV